MLWASSAAAFDGSLSAELSYGNRTFSANVIGDWGVVPERLYVVATYGVVRFLPDDNWRAQPTHLFGLGLDWLPSMHWVASLNATFSPKTTDVEMFPALGVSISHTRRNVHGLLAVAYQSAGMSDVEWGVDGSGLVGWYELSSEAEGPKNTINRGSSLVAVKPALGATLTLFDDNELGARATYTWYSQDPTTAPLFQAVEQRFGQSDASASFFSAPVWLEARASYLRRFGAKVTGRLAYTYIQYVPGKGNAHALSTRWTWRVAGWARLWVGATLQLDVPAGLSGYGTLGAELATE